MTTKQIRHLGLGISLLGFGILYYTGYWWPGIFYVLGISSGVTGILDKQPLKQFTGTAFFLISALLVTFNVHLGFLNSDAFWAGVLMVLGAFVILRSFFQKLG